jgi:hypothetical protein
MERYIIQKIRRRNANWIGHILSRNCLLKHVIEGKVEEGIKVTERRGRRHKKVQGDFKKKQVTVIFIVAPCILKSKTSHSPTTALFIKLGLKFTLKFT